MRLYYNITLFICLLSYSSTTLSFDYAHFYRATPLVHEPRIARDGLFTAELTVLGGQTSTARNSDGDKVPLLEIWGSNSMQPLGTNIPNKSLTNPLDIVLIQLERTQGQDNFATFCFNGTFSIFEAFIDITQNLNCGFFLQAFLPVRRLSISDVCFTDISPEEEDACPNRDTPVWVAFKDNFNAILAEHGLSLEPVKETGVGDLSLLIGWTNNYEDLCRIDFIDTTVRLGVLAPTGKKKDQDKILSLPLGYNGFWAMVISTDLALGLCEWLTFGGHLDALVFFPRNECVRLKTSPFQSSLIKLSKEEAKINPGVVWTAGVFAKGDHMIRGFSWLFGYTFAQKTNDTVKIDCAPCFPCFMDQDETFLSWSMHTLNFYLEYDFTEYECWWGPRVGIFYNLIVGGTRIFNTNTPGVRFGLDVDWAF